MVRNGDLAESSHGTSIFGFQSAPLIFEHLRREGVLAPGIRFVKVRLDAAELGLMALEERYSKELLESQQRRAVDISSREVACRWEAVGVVRHVSPEHRDGFQDSLARAVARFSLFGAEFGKIGTSF